MFTQQMEKVIMAVVGSLFVTMPAYTNNVYMEWVVYDGCTNIDFDVVNGWNDGANYLLCHDSDGAGPNDVSVDTTLVIEGGSISNPNWTCWFGDDEVLSSFTANAILLALATHSEDVCGVTKIEYGGQVYAGVSNGDNSIIMSGERGDGGTLAHEVGHNADLDHVTGEANKDRVMYETTAGSEEEVRTSCPVNGNEQTAYESLTSP